METKNVIVIMDKSGSMQAMGDEPIEALNIFLDDQIENNKKGKLTLILFNHKVKEVFRNKTIESINKSKIEFNPKGMTALYDAIGKGIKDSIDKKIKDISVVIITDGIENSSQEFSKADIKDLVEKSKNKLGWSYTYLGANQDSFTVGGGLGIGDCSNFESKTPGSLSQVIRHTSESITTPLKALPLKRCRLSSKF